MGAAFGTSKAGIGITGLGTMRPELIMKVSHAGKRRVHLHFADFPCVYQSLIPVVCVGRSTRGMLEFANRAMCTTSMAGIIAVYGLVVSVLIIGNRASILAIVKPSPNSTSQCHRISPIRFTSSLDYRTLAY